MAALLLPHPLLLLLLHLLLHHLLLLLLHLLLLLLHLLTAAIREREAGLCSLRPPPHSPLIPFWCNNSNSRTGAPATRWSALY